jgi:hypothetical protein
MTRAVDDAMRSSVVMSCLLVPIACGSSVRLDIEDATGGAGGAAGSAGLSGGADQVCQPGEERPCYDGPTGTADVGLCRSGVAVCAPDGSGFGACDGMILPTDEICADELDHDCDGLSGCAPSVDWAQRFGTADDQTATDLAVDGFGVVFVGNFEGSTSFGGPPLTSAGNRDAFVARIAHFGSDVYSRRFGGPGDDEATGIAVDATDRALMLGIADGKIDVEGFPEGDDRDLFALVLEEGGAVATQQRWNGPGNEQGALRAAGSPFLVAGFHTTAIDLGLATIPSPSADHLVVAELDPLLTASWVAGSTSTTAQAVLDLAQDDGVSVVVGRFSESLELAGESVSAPGGPHGFVAALDGQGDAVWLKVLRGPNLRITGVAIANGQIALAGSHGGVIIDSEGQTHHGDSGLFVMTLSQGGNLDQIWLAGGADVGSPRVCAGFGGFIVGGRFSAPLTVGDYTAVNNSTSDAFLLSFGDAGPRWAMQWGGPARADVTGLGRGPTSDLFLVGNFYDGPLTMGDEALAHTGDADIFLARLVAAQ